MIDIFDSPIINVFKNKITQFELFEFVNEQLMHKKYVNKGYIDEIIEREKKYPTGLDAGYGGIAIPHVDSDKINKSTLVINKLYKPMKWASMENPNEEIIVSFVFFLILNKDSDHLSALKTVISFIQDKKFMNSLMMVNTKKEIKLLLERR